MNRTHPDFDSFQKVDRIEMINKLCPRCDQIVNYGFRKEEVSEYCYGCGYDLRRPINPVRNFFHKLFFWDNAWKYPLAHCERGHKELKELEKMKRGYKK